MENLTQVLERIWQELPADAGKAFYGNLIVHHLPEAQWTSC
jgi:hypothetical protein